MRQEETDNKEVNQIVGEVRDLASSVEHTIASLQKTREAIDESSKKVPEANAQLSRVTQATSEASLTLLGIAEKLAERESKFKEEVEQQMSLCDSDPAQLKKKLGEWRDMAQTNIDDAYAIMTAMQFQDITAQQIDFSLSVLADVEITLRNIISLMEGNDFKEMLCKGVSKGRDPRIPLANTGVSQSQIDSLVQDSEKIQSK